MNALKIVIEVRGTLCLTVRQANPPVLEVAYAAVVGLADQEQDHDDRRKDKKHKIMFFEVKPLEFRL